MATKVPDGWDGTDDYISVQKWTLWRSLYLKWKLFRLLGLRATWNVLRAARQTGEEQRKADTDGD